jgi:hypothetical protein
MHVITKTNSSIKCTVFIKSKETYLLEFPDISQPELTNQTQLFGFLLVIVDTSNWSDRFGRVTTFVSLSIQKFRQNTGGGSGNSSPTSR